MGRGGRNKIDLTGQQLGRLTVVTEAAQRAVTGHVSWVCRCECGKVVVVDGHNLRTGNTKSCGCAKGPRRRKEASDARASDQSHPGAVVACLRKQRGWTTHRLATVAGINPTQLYRIEAGEQSMRIETAQALARALGVSMAVFDSQGGP